MIGGPWTWSMIGVHGPGMDPVHGLEVHVLYFPLILLSSCVTGILFTAATCRISTVEVIMSVSC